MYEHGMVFLFLASEVTLGHQGEAVQQIHHKQEGLLSQSGGCKEEPLFQKSFSGCLFHSCKHDIRERNHSASYLQTRNSVVYSNSALTQLPRALRVQS